MRQFDDFQYLISMRNASKYIIIRYVTFSNNDDDDEQAKRVLVLVYFLRKY